MKHPDLTKLFNKFAGKELKNPDRLTCDIDTTLEEMRQVAKDNGIRLRVIFPGSRITMDARADRVNARVEKGTDGKFRISKLYVG